MTKPITTHATFVIERTYAHPPAKVFAAFANPPSKAKWFGGPAEWEQSPHTLDFRVGGKETASGGPVGGPVHYYDATIWDIVENERIVLAYEMRMDNTRASVSLATTEIKPDGAGSKLIYTEQGVYLDGVFDGSGNAVGREQGTNDLFDKLDAFLKS